jgi:hypothetical protein
MSTAASILATGLVNRHRQERVMSAYRAGREARTPPLEAVSGTKIRVDARRCELDGLLAPLFRQPE